MVALTDAQIAQFCRDGVLHIPGFFSPEQIAEWRIQTYDHSAADPADPTTWPGGGSTGVGRYLHRADDPDIQARLVYPYEGLPHTFTGVVREGRGPAVDPRPVSPAIGETQLGDIVDQLLGLENVADGLRPGPENDTMVIQWPTPEADGQPRGHRQWGPPQSGHIEGYNPTKGGWKGGFLLGALTYLEDVQTSGCGAFYYWPGSHLPLQRFFHENPGRLVDGCPLDPAAPDNPARGNAPLDTLIDTHGTWCTDVLNEHCPGGYNRQPREWLAPAGDLLLWCAVPPFSFCLKPRTYLNTTIFCSSQLHRRHHWIVHSGTTNARGRVPRFGLFGRWHHKERETMRFNIAGIQDAPAREDNLADTLWKDWKPAVKRVVSGRRGERQGTAKL